MISAEIHPSQAPDPVKGAQRRRQVDMSNMRTSKSDFSQYSSTGGGSQEKNQKIEPVRVDKKIGRNDPCPCGSGKKYKQCHGVQLSGAPDANANA